VSAVPPALVLLLAASALAQTPTQVVATYTGNESQGTVTSDDVALEVAPRYRRTPRGEETITHLIDVHVVRTAAEGKGLLPSAADVARQIKTYRDAITAQGRDPDQFLATRVTASEFEAYTGLTMALDRLVVAQLGLKDNSGVTDEYRELWLRDAKKAANVVTDEAALPAGIVARAGSRSFTLLYLGRVLVEAERASPVRAPDHLAPHPRGRS
jgi:hypothetical protein